jgi:hypothetical protein
MDSRQLRGAALLLFSVSTGGGMLAWLLSGSATPVALVLVIPSVLVAVHLFWFASQVFLHN